MKSIIGLLLLTLLASCSNVSAFEVSPTIFPLTSPPEKSTGDNSVITRPISTATDLPATATLEDTATAVSSTIESTVSATPDIRTLAGPSTTPETSLPLEHYITNIFGHKQYFSLGCEAAVAKDWAAFFGVDLNEFQFQYELPLSDNPDKGFVGDVNGPWGQVPPYAYGVHAAPIAELLREYGVPAGGYKGLTIEQIREELANDQPVIAWVIGNVAGGVPATFTDQEGDSTIVAAYEHVVLVTGYGENTIRYNSNGKFYDTPVDVFLNSWGVLGNMAIIYEEDITH